MAGEHGTIAAYMRHRRCGDAPCGPCRKAKNLYAREQYRDSAARQRDGREPRRLERLHGKRSGIRWHCEQDEPPCDRCRAALGTFKDIYWPAVMIQAREIVRSRATPTTLRELFRELVAAQMLPDRQQPYKRLSRLAAQGRRTGTFPALANPRLGLAGVRAAATTKKRTRMAQYAAMLDADPWLTAEAAADKLGVCRETIYRDRASLGLTGKRPPSSSQPLNGTVQ